MKTETQDTTAPAVPLPDDVVELDTPIRRGGGDVSRLILRKPNAGELRGLHLLDLLQLDVASIIKVLPRITSPGITEPEAAAMDPADLLACGTKISTFLLQKQAKAQASLLA
ncbi:phage tail assembly protein [Pseudomonas knackmussii]|uniref:phage tail assembly protein n=1 Tax=Pseudomonas knackmussii TaxID=65741 RepID=UPI003F49ED5D